MMRRDGWSGAVTKTFLGHSPSLVCGCIVQLSISHSSYLRSRPIIHVAEAPLRYIHLPRPTSHHVNSNSFNPAPQGSTFHKSCSQPLILAFFPLDRPPFFSELIRSNVLLAAAKLSTNSCILPVFSKRRIRSELSSAMLVAKSMHSMR